MKISHLKKNQHTAPLVKTKCGQVVFQSRLVGVAGVFKYEMGRGIFLPSDKVLTQNNVLFFQDR